MYLIYFLKYNVYLLFYCFVSHPETLLALTVTVNRNLVALYVYRNTRIILCYSLKLRSGKKCTYAEL